MHALIFGATGRTGSLVVTELLKRGHTVSALARNLPTTSTPNLNFIKGTPLNQNDVDSAFQFQKPDVVIVTLAATRASDSPFAAPTSAPRFMADSNANIVSSMKKFGVQRIIIMQALGAGKSWDNMSCVLRLLMKHSNMIYGYQDHDLVDKEVRESGITYVFARPARLTEGEAKAAKVWEEDGKGVPLMASMSRNSVASWLVDAAESREWDGSAPVLTDN